MSGYLDRGRAARLMASQGLDALLLAQPESIRYVSGASPGVAASWRRAGAAFVLVPSDEAAPLAAIVGDLEADTFVRQSAIEDVRSHPIWVETAGPGPGGLAENDDIVEALVAEDLRRGRTPAFRRPATFDRDLVLDRLAGLLRERGLARAKIGLEMGFVPVSDFQAIQRALAGIAWRDASPLVARLRMIKHPEEVAKLRLAAELSATGFAHLVSKIRPGLDAGAMTDLWRGAVLDAAAGLGQHRLTSTWAYISVGGDGFAPGGPAAIGDVIKIDVGCLVDGYSSDMARSLVLGRASFRQRRLYDILRLGFDAGLAALAERRAFREIHASVQMTIRNAGLATYARGHFGHSLGASAWSEEWPFIAADCDLAPEAGMVLALEAPYYVRGLGGFIIEDQLRIGDSSIEVLAPLSRDFVEIEV
jgi:Xaa-Pro dipeptidase